MHDHVTIRLMHGPKNIQGHVAHFRILSRHGSVLNQINIRSMDVTIQPKEYAGHYSQINIRIIQSQACSFPIRHESWLNTHKNHAWTGTDSFRCITTIHIHAPIACYINNRCIVIVVIANYIHKRTMHAGQPICSYEQIHLSYCHIP